MHYFEKQRKSGLLENWAIQLRVLFYRYLVHCRCHWIVIFEAMFSGLPTKYNIANVRSYKLTKEAIISNQMYVRWNTDFTVTNNLWNIGYRNPNVKTEILHIKQKGLHTTCIYKYTKTQKNKLKRGERSDTYLTHVYSWCKPQCWLITPVLWTFYALQLSADMSQVDFSPFSVISHFKIFALH